MEMPASRVDRIQVCTVNIANVVTKRRWRNCQSSRKTDRQRFRWAHCTLLVILMRCAVSILMHQMTQKLGRNKLCVQASVCITRFEDSERHQARPAVGDSKQGNLQQ